MSITYFPLSRLEKVVRQGLPKNSVDASDKKIIKTLKLLGAAKSFYRYKFMRAATTLALNEDDAGPCQRIRVCQAEFIKNLKNNPNYEISTEVPLKITSPSGQKLCTAENIITIVYTQKSGKTGSPVIAASNFIQRTVEKWMLFGMIRKAYKFDDIAKGV